MKDVKVLDRISLDLDKDVLMGWEKIKSALLVADYVGRNLSGEKAPPVEVIEKDGIYQIVCGENPDNSAHWEWNYNYGGHHRAVSHFISGKRLDCFLMEDHRASDTYEYCDFFSINETRLSLYDDYAVKIFLRNISTDICDKFIEMCDFRSDNERDFYLESLKK